MNLKTNKCYACGQDIIWCRDPIGNVEMIDAVESLHGNVMLIPDPLVPEEKQHKAKPVAMYVHPRRLKRRKEQEGQADLLFDNGTRYTNHLKTCPNKEDL